MARCHSDRAVSLVFVIHRRTLVVLSRSWEGFNTYRRIVGKPFNLKAVFAASSLLVVIRNDFVELPDGADIAGQ